jgi:hypothetical protein
MTKPNQCNQCIELRKQGLSISNIAKQVHVSKSSVSIWVRDIELTQSQKNVLYKNRGNSINHNNIKINARDKRLEFYQDGYNRAKIDTDFQLICMLYWGEGSKSQNEFRIANADNNIIRIAFNWLKKEGYFDNIVFTVCYHTENGLSEQDIKNWWLSNIPGLENKHFRKFSIKDTSKFKTKKIGKLPYGTGYINVYRTKLIQQVLGGIKYLQDNFMNIYGGIAN